jgi:hypothetical protein
MVASGPLTTADVAVLMDKGNVGTAVEEMFGQVGLPIIPVLIHGGAKMHFNLTTRTYSVPKRDLVQAAQVC